ncbi:MAG: radical SAM protein [Planctomycetes bacterium]|nr:radical SAM protein [Planctomycetota bacterium]
MLPTAPAKTYYETVSMCPACAATVPGRVVGRPAGVFVARECPDHGPFEGIVCSDVAWFEGLARFDVEPVKPVRPPGRTARGCPEDCGLCPAHRQIAGTAAIEISNRCNADCPVCLADNRRTFELSPEQVRSMIDAFLRTQETVDAVAVSGGEPTIHPRIFDILRVLDRPEIGRILLNSNGVRIANDDGFLDELARHRNVYVSLHFDGAGARRLRGTGAEVQERALERLGRWGVAVAPLVLAAQGVNDGDLGRIVTSLLARSSVRSVVLSMMCYAGANGSRFPGDPLTRLTIPAALDRIEEGSERRLRKRDFIPLPMPNPMCAAVGYFLTVGGEITPLIPMADLDEVVRCLRNANFARVDEDIERLIRGTIDRIYSRPGEFPDAPRLLAKFRDLLSALFPEGRPLDAGRQRAVVEERVKTVYLMQFMDPWTFDSKRLCKCSCQHLLPDGRIVPSCGYYAYHRRFDARFR